MLQVQVNLKSSDFFVICFGMDTVISISEVARRSGVASSALRFYEERGLIASERAGSGHRRYPRSVLRRIAFIVFAQKIGLTLEEIGAELAKLPPDRVPTRARLGEAFRRMVGADRSADRGASAAPRQPHRMHRLRLPVDRPLQARQSGGRRGEGGAGAEVLDGVRGAPEQPGHGNQEDRAKNGNAIAPRTALVQCATHAGNAGASRVVRAAASAPTVQGLAVAT